MNILKNIKQFFADFFKKKYIRKELKLKFKHYKKDTNKHNRERLDLLTDSLFRASKIVKKEILENERKCLENENELLFGDIKNIIDKHYKDREDSLKKENIKLEKKIVEKDKVINKIKEKISTVANSN